MTASDSILFDLDGTLVDTAPDIAATLDIVLKAAGRPPVGLNAVRHMIGDGAKALLERGFVASGGMPEPKAMQAALDHFMSHYEAHIADHSRPFPGLVSALEDLKAGGARLVVCTNKIERFSRKLLDELRLSHLFDAIVAGDSLPVKKPDPGHILGSLAAVAGRPERAVMVGDSMNDVAAAKAARVPVIAVSFGYTGVPPAQLGADALIDSFDQLIPELKRLLQGMRA